MSDPAKTYRDATFSRETRNLLVTARHTLRDIPLSDEGRAAVAALDNVVERWDANEATEFVAEEDEVA